MYMPHDVLRRRPRRRKRFRGLEDGQGLVEYALLLALVALVVIVVLSTVGQAVSNVFENITCNLDTESDCGSTVAMAPPDDSGGGSGSGSGTGSESGSGSGSGSESGSGSGSESGSGSGSGSGSESGSGSGSGSGSESGSGSGSGSGSESGSGSGSGSGSESGSGSGSGSGSESGSGSGSGSESGSGSGSESGSGSGVPTTNQSPTMIDLTPQSINEGTITSILFNASDPEGDALVYTVVGLSSSFMTFADNGDGSAILVVAPNYTKAGTYTVNVSVGDGISAPDAQNVDITINNVIHDTDGDTVEDEVDNCPLAANTAQDDWDDDDLGDACDGHYYLRFGSTSSILDSDGNTWKAFTATATSGTIYSVTPTSITGITEPAVCQTLVEARSSSTGKDLNVSFSDLPGGSYVLNLYFAETRASNQGKFSILVEGVKKVNKYEPNDKGYKVAHKVTTTAQTISDGTLTLKLDQSSGIPSLCAMEIIKQ